MQKQTSITKIHESAKGLLENAGPGSKTAVIVAGHRFDESQKPEDERICYDPYAVHFVTPELRELNKDPLKVKAMLESLGDVGILLLGMSNSTRARVRYFDDFVKASIDKGLEQLVILGAGYDTRAYRIEGLNGKGNIKVFEVDHPVTQEVKTEKIKEIFGELPDHVVYVPIDLMTDNLGEKLLENGYDKSKQTLFLMEGLLMYLQPSAVNGILSFIAENSGKESSIIFDYYPQSVVDGSSELEVGRITHDYLAQIGEPLQFGIKEGMVEEFLKKRGFSQVCNVTSEDYRRAYFHGANKDRPVCSLMSFAHAVVE
ncbi:MAG TPA: class I SAM-dependent methyltransferase [Methanotrichaceae archaeon]|nr:class I SAM-dependent methyltransferase [Methanotrichaceae archaeon]